jgi:protein-S-isoprenylcysteine O-methyltransferase Ste14
MDYLGLAAAWVVWAALHSLLLHPPIKARLTRRWEWVDCHWRLFFSAVAVITILPPIWLTYALNGPLVLVWPSWAFWPLVVINLLALGVGWAALRQFGGAWSFLGLAPLPDGCEPGPPAEPVREGVLGWVRHPLYAASLVLLWAHDHRAAWLAASIVLTIYLFVGTWLEERKLEAEWGESWRRYRRDVSAFIPVKRLRRLGAERRKQ